MNANGVYHRPSRCTMHLLSLADSSHTTKRVSKLLVVWPPFKGSYRNVLHWRGLGNFSFELYGHTVAWNGTHHERRELFKSKCTHQTTGKRLEDSKRDLQHFASNGVKR